MAAASEHTPARVTALGTRIDSLDSEVKRLTNQINSMDGGRLAASLEKLTGHKTVSDFLSQNNIPALQQLFTGLTKLKEFEQSQRSDDVKQINARLDSLTKNVTEVGIQWGIYSSITAPARDKRIRKLEDEVKKINDEIGQLKADAPKAAPIDLKTMSGFVQNEIASQLKPEISRIEQQIDGLKQKDTKLNTQVTDIEGKTATTIKQLTDVIQELQKLDARVAAHVIHPPVIANQPDVAMGNKINGFLASIDAMVHSVIRG